MHRREMMIQNQNQSKVYERSIRMKAFHWDLTSEPSIKIMENWVSYPMDVISSQSKIRFQSYDRFSKYVSIWRLKETHLEIFLWRPEVVATWCTREMTPLEATEMLHQENDIVGPRWDHVAVSWHRWGQSEFCVD